MRKLYPFRLICEITLLAGIWGSACNSSGGDANNPEKQGAENAKSISAQKTEEQLQKEKSIAGIDLGANGKIEEAQFKALEYRNLIVESRNKVIAAALAIEKANETGDGVMAEKQLALGQEEAKTAFAFLNKLDDFEGHKRLREIAVESVRTLDHLLNNDYSELAGLIMKGTDKPRQKALLQDVRALREEDKLVFENADLSFRLTFKLTSGK